MDMEGLHSFIAVARERSISKASQSLHLSQPSLSARLRKLEEGLGVKLLERSWDGIKLTNQGRLFLSYSVQLLQELEEAATLLSREGELKGPIEALTSADRLHVGIEPFFYPAFLEPVIQGVRESSPDMECRFVCKPSEVLFTLEAHGGLHVCVNFDYRLVPGHVQLPLFEDRVVLLCPLAGYPEVRDDLGNVAVLKDKPFILFESSPLLRYREVTERIFLNLYDSVPVSFHIVADVQAMTAILTAGFGYTFTTLSSIAHLLGGPLPFKVIPMDTSYINALNVYVSYSPAASPVAGHAVEMVARGIRDAILRRYGGDFPRSAAV